HDDNQMFGYEPLRLLGSPAASTAWVLLLIAAQQGDITSTLQRWEHVAVSVAAWTIGGLLAAGVLGLIANRYRFGELVEVAVLAGGSRGISRWNRSMRDDLCDHPRGHLAATVGHQLDECTGVRPQSQSPQRDRAGTR
ncbi:MAG: hypothetical protein ACK5LS_07275, partial [Propioniciclava sp.]